MPYIILSVIIGIGIALFASQNAVGVSLNFLGFTFESSLVLVILGSFLLGLLLSCFFMLYMKAKHYFAQRKLNDDNEMLTSELARLKVDLKAAEEVKQMLAQEVAQLKQQLAGKSKQEAASAPSVAPDEADVK